MQTSAYALSSSDLQTDEPLIIFLCQYYSDDEITPTRRWLWTSFVNRIVPHSKFRVRLSTNGNTPLRDDCGPALLMELSATQSPARVHLSTDGIIPTQRWLRTHSAAGIVPHSESKVCRSSDGIIATWRWLWTQSTTGIVPTRNLKFAAPLLGLLFGQKNSK